MQAHPIAYALGISETLHFPFVSLKSRVLFSASLWELEGTAQNVLRLLRRAAGKKLALRCEKKRILILLALDGSATRLYNGAAKQPRIIKVFLSCFGNAERTAVLQVRQGSLATKFKLFFSGCGSPTLLYCPLAVLLRCLCGSVCRLRSVACKIPLALRVSL